MSLLSENFFDFSYQILVLSFYFRELDFLLQISLQINFMALSRVLKYDIWPYTLNSFKYFEVLVLERGLTMASVKASLTLNENRQFSHI